MTWLRRAWRWLTTPPPETCPICDRPLEQHPDGGSGAWCPICEKVWM